MAKDEVIALAVKAGLIRVGDGWTEPHRWGLAELEAFANLVASVARNMKFTQENWTDYEESIVAAEREECAKVCLDTESFYGIMIANAIRARGNT